MGMKPPDRDRSSKGGMLIAGGALAALAIAGAIHSKDKSGSNQEASAQGDLQTERDAVGGKVEGVLNPKKDFQVVTSENFTYEGGRIIVPDRQDAIDFVHKNPKSNNPKAISWQVENGLDKHRSEDDKALANLMKKEGNAWKKLHPSTDYYRELGVDFDNMAIVLKGTAEVFFRDVANMANAYLHKHGMPKRYQVRLHISSAYRTHKFQEQLKERNDNTSKDPRGSAHERGNTVDIPYARLDLCDTQTNECLMVREGDNLDKKTGVVHAYKQSLAVIFKEMIEKDQAFVKFEKSSGSVCYHAVDRYGWKSKSTTTPAKQ